MMLVSHLISKIQKWADPNSEEISALDLLRESMKFEIDLSAEAISAACNYAEQLNTFGLLHLPYPKTYFEFPVFDDEYNERFVYGVLAWSELGEIRCRGYQISENGMIVSGGCVFDPVKVVASKAYSRVFANEETRFLCPEHVKLDGVPLAHGWEDADVLRIARAMVMVVAGLVFAGIGSLSLRGVSRVVKSPSAKVNKSRILKRHEPYYSHTIVSIRNDPSRDDGPVKSRDLLGFRMPIRIHWRRGHVRRLASGHVVSVRPCLVGDPEQGIVTHEYRVSA